LAASFFYTLIVYAELAEQLPNLLDF